MAGLSQNDLLLMKQKIEVLAGERGDPQKAAIRMIYLKTLQDLISKLRGSTNDIQLAVSVLDQAVSQTQVQIGNVQGAVNDLQVDVNGLEGTVGQITTDVAHIQNDLAAATGDLDQLVLDISDLQIIINDLETSTGSTGAALTELKTDVAAVTVPVMQQGAVAAAPTMAQFNLLVGDVAAVRQAVVDLKNAIA